MKLLLAFGEEKSELAWSNDPRCVISRPGLRKRLREGWSLEEALTTPPKTNGSACGNKGAPLTAFGETKSIHAWASDARCKVSRSGLRQRLAKGQSPEQALQGEPLRSQTFGLRVAFGEGKSLADWQRDPRCVVSYDTLLLRMSNGMALEEALTTAYRDLRFANSDQYEAFGESKSLAQWVLDPRCVVTEPSTLHARIHKLGIPIEVAIADDTIRWGAPSMAESELANFVESLGLEVRRGDRSVIGRELDVYVPSKNLAIEYNGLFWHNDLVKPERDYHFKKWAACRDAGVSLVQVWEDDYRAKPEVVRAMLKHKLGMVNDRLFARKLDVLPDLPRQDAKLFLDRWHIQGSSKASWNVGLVDRLAGLVAVAGFRRRSDHEWELGRYATSVLVVGGFSKCLRQFERTVTNCRRLVTFSDCSVSDGGLYEATGFVAEKVLRPDYSYLIGGRRVHKFNYRLSRFKNDSALEYVEGLTEYQLARLNGLHRIWDAGKVRWVRTY